MPAILSRIENLPKREEEVVEVQEELKDMDHYQSPPSTPIENVPEEITRRDTVIVPITDSQIPPVLPFAESILEILHEEHKNISPLLCLALLYVFVSADTNWFIMAFLQIGIQALFFSKSMLKSPIGRRFLLFFSLTMMTSSIISLSMVRPAEFNAPIGQQLFIYFFFVCSFIGFVLTNIYNINLIFVFGRNVKWVLHGENEEERERDFD